jgi:hypothetical protein
LALSLAACGSGGTSDPVKPETDPGTKIETNVDGIVTPLPTLEVQPEEIAAATLPTIGLGQTRSSKGLWLETQTWPLIPIHATLLPPKEASGPSSVLTWGWNTPYVKANEGTTFVDEFSPSSGTHTPSEMKSGTNGDMFGNGHAFTEEGDLFMAGGSQPLNAKGNWPGMADVFERNLEHPAQDDPRALVSDRDPVAQR